jgi:hypothetical protein
MTNELTSRVLSDLAELQQLHSSAQQRIAALTSLLLGQRAGAAVAAAEPRTQIERVLAYFQEHSERAVPKAELKEAFADISDNSLGGVLTRLKNRRLIAPTGWGAYRLAPSVAPRRR